MVRQELEYRKRALPLPGCQSIQSIEALVGIESQKPHHLRLQIVARTVIEFEREVVGLSDERDVR